MQEYRNTRIQEYKNIPNFRAFSSREELAQELAKTVAADLQKAIESRGVATLVVSGGSTPKPFFVALQQEALKWSSLVVTVADERWVPADHDDSNERLVREHLLGQLLPLQGEDTGGDESHPHPNPLPQGRGDSSQARFVSLYNGAPTAISGEEKAEEDIRHMVLPFDVTILGMGPDGHTASLFPHHERLEDALESSQRLCLGIENAPKPPPERITLTRHALMQSRRLILHVTGTDKKDVLEAATKPGPEADFPIRAFLHQDDVPLEIYWAE